jgi:hypothetical protein
MVGRAAGLEAAHRNHSPQAGRFSALARAQTRARPTKPGARLRRACGGVAQLGERRVRNAKVGSSILLLSTTFFSGAHERRTNGAQTVHKRRTTPARPPLQPWAFKRSFCGNIALRASSSISALKL